MILFSIFHKALNLLRPLKPDRLSPQIRQYLLITGNYWAFTLTDGALRMLVILHFNGLGYSPLEIAMLFLFYEFFGIITNLIGGWLGAHLGLNTTMNIGLAIQIITLGLLMVPDSLLSVPLVMAAQALSGIAKDLNKMSAKSTIKLLVADNTQDKLYRWVAILTGSKNTLKGAGFFLGGTLLALFEFRGAVGIMALALTLVWVFSLFTLKKDFGKATFKPKFSSLFSKSHAINSLSAARLFLFAARDVWFVVALPVYLSSHLQWNTWTVSGFLAIWIIGYGFAQTLTPILTQITSTKTPNGKSAFHWAATLAIIPAIIAIGLYINIETKWTLLGGLIIFGILFAINSALHSYLILSYANEDGVSLDVGFYYMANASGRLLGTVLSGWIYQLAGLEACLSVSAIFIILAALISRMLPTIENT